MGPTVRLKYSCLREHACGEWLEPENQADHIPSIGFERGYNFSHTGQSCGGFVGTRSAKFRIPREPCGDHSAGRLIASANNKVVENTVHSSATTKSVKLREEVV